MLATRSVDEQSHDQFEQHQHPTNQLAVIRWLSSLQAPVARFDTLIGRFWKYLGLGGLA